LKWAFLGRHIWKHKVIRLQVSNFLKHFHNNHLLLIEVITCPWNLIVSINFYQIRKVHFILPKGSSFCSILSLHQYINIQIISFFIIADHSRRLKCNQVNRFFYTRWRHLQKKLCNSFLASANENYFYSMLMRIFTISLLTLTLRKCSLALMF